ncbi:MAG: alpha/beta fold hydrolase [Actinobacteria bacterium]|uniref:Unannotated protein n=1 Tax=freshwater metagenome TaxID=449393 RepID=A0A6J6S080_9ZZZZ|nr:alpha/beta fold hydrolase [Actinomycetota bacterium]
MSDSTIGAFLLPPGYRRPPAAAMLREGFLVGEAGRCAVHSISERRARRSRPYAGATPARDADPVLLVPGFLAGDYSLRVLSSTLRGAGLRTYRAHMTANVGCTLNAAAMLEARLESIATKRGSRVQIVGHSLGGMLARGIAVRRPDLVSGIVTMGSPMMAPGAHHIALTAGAGALVGLSRAGIPGVMSEECVSGGCARTSFEECRLPLPEGVGFTAIYSRRDGIVDWRACIDPIARAVEVKASHIGMAVDPRVHAQVLSALQRQQVAAVASVLEVDRGVGA